MNYGLIMVAIASLLVLVVVSMIKTNKKDRKEFEEKLNQDYRRPKQQDVEDQGTDTV